MSTEGLAVSRDLTGPCEGEPNVKTMPIWMKVVFPVVIVAIAFGGVMFYRMERQGHATQIEMELAAIGRLKAEQIELWTRERRADAGVLTALPKLRQEVSFYVGDPTNVVVEDELRTRFRDLQEKYGYEDVLLVDPDGSILMSVAGRTGPMGTLARRALLQAARSRLPVVSDIQFDQFQKAAHVSTFAPIYAPGDDDEPAALIVLLSDAMTSLFPIVQSWPTRSRTAETLLVRQEEDSVVFLNELRHAENAALALRLPMSRTDLPAVAAASGDYGVMRGRDYRDVEVLAVALDVPGLPWSMVAKMDAEEAFAPVRRRSVLLLSTIAGTLLLLVLAFVLVWQRGERTRFKRLFEAETALSHMGERLGITLKSIGDAVISTDADGRVELMNHEAERLTGWQAEGAHGRPLDEVLSIRSEKTGDRVENPVETVLSEGVIVALGNKSVLVSRDGTEHPIADSAAPIRDEEGDTVGVVLVFRDMTEERERRRRLEAVHRRQNHLVSVLTAIRDVNQLTIREKDIDRLIQGACIAMTETLRRGSAYIVLVDTEGGLLTMAASGDQSAADRLRAAAAMGRVSHCIREILESPGVTTIPHAPGDLNAVGDGDEAAFGARLEFGGTVYGAFVVSVPREFMTDESERRLFGEMANDIAFAIRQIEQSKQQRELRERYKLLAENTVDCIWLMGLDERFIYINPASESLFGYTPEEMIGTHLRDYVAGKEYVRIENAIREAVSALPERLSTVLETCMLHRNGAEVPLEVAAKFVLDDDGHPVAIQGVSRDITERKLAEEELHEQERILNETGRMAKIGGWEHDMATGEAVWTRALYDIIGIEYGTRPPGVHEHFDYYLDEDRAILEKAYWRAVEDGEPFDLELQVRTAPGVVIWCRAYGEPVVENGRCIRLRGTFQDITERKRAESERERTQQLLHFAVEQSPVPVIIAAAPDVTITHINQAAKDLLVQIPDDIGEIRLDEHREYWPTFHPDGTPYCVEDLPLTRAIQKGETTEGAEIIVRRPDGDEWIAASAAPLRSRTGKTIAGIVVFPMITEQKTAIDALRESERRWRSYVESAPYGVFVVDESGRYIDVNPEACRMSGYSEEELLSMRVLELSSPAEREAGLESFRFLAERGAWEGEIEIERKDGDVRRWLLAAVRLSERRYLGFTHDITERKWAEEERERLQAELMQAQKMESVGRLAGGVAHDFNNMLQVMLGGTELLLGKLAQESELRDEIEEIRSAAERSAELTRQLLAFARKQVAEPKLLNLNQTVGGTTKMLNRLIAEEIELDWESASESWHVRIDPTQVNQILANLVVNASDAIDGAGRIVIGTENITVSEGESISEEDPAPGEYVVLTVADTGRGMDAETLSKIFDPFFTSKGVGEGTGLGLSTVYGIVRQNNGHISVDSQPGEGTTFTVYFPRYEGEEDRTAGRPTGRKQEGKGEVLVVVEDEESILRLCESALSRIGYTVHPAGTPSEALALLDDIDEVPALLITDVVMPEMDGRELANRVLERFLDIRVLFMSGYTADAIARRGIVEDGVSLIQKPFQVRELAEKVREVLDEQIPKE
ncbi:MAG: PAS domain S-box protein [Candidatus Eisenbacteria bacterium]|nr:PAS domain S-box protein [Candidatus Eisenbacteria bacterium]